jgi:hypothetical protein
MTPCIYIYSLVFTDNFAKFSALKTEAICSSETTINVFLQHGVLSLISRNYFMFYMQQVWALRSISVLEPHVRVIYTVLALGMTFRSKARTSLVNVIRRWVYAMHQALVISLSLSVSFAQHYPPSSSSLNPSLPAHRIAYRTPPLPRPTTTTYLVARTAYRTGNACKSDPGSLKSCSHLLGNGNLNFAAYVGS